ncbi:MAG: membrane protein insertion efficiency factor YidD [Bacteroidales bacterium]|nr:membrane protein insertion efficiency factor YidD [Bacteroidales bacterium]
MKIIRKIFAFPFILLIQIYRKLISPMLPNSCRYTPTCSEYGLQSFRKHGPIKGFFLTARRILSCNPWGGSGYDPVPDVCTWKYVFGKRPKNPDLDKDYVDNQCNE